MTPTIRSEIHFSRVETKDEYRLGSSEPVFHVCSTVLYIKGDTNTIIEWFLETNKCWKYRRRKKVEPALTGSPTVQAKIAIWLTPTFKVTGFWNSKPFSSWLPWFDPLLKPPRHLISQILTPTLVSHREHIYSTLPCMHEIE